MIKDFFNVYIALYWKYTQKHIRKPACARMHTHIHTPVHKHAQRNTHTNTYTQTCTEKHTHTNTYTQTCTEKHTHAQTPIYKHAQRNAHTLMIREPAPTAEMLTQFWPIFLPPYFHSVVGQTLHSLFAHTVLQTIATFNTETVLLMIWLWKQFTIHVVLTLSVRCFNIMEVMCVINYHLFICLFGTDYLFMVSHLMRAQGVYNGT